MSPLKPPASFGARPARRSPTSSPRRDGERGPRREGDRPERSERRFDNDRPSFRQDDRGPRRDGERQERGPRSDRPQRDFSDRPQRGDFHRAPQRSATAPEGEQQRGRGSIRTYRAPASLKGKAAPIKVIRAEDKPQEAAGPGFRKRKPRPE